MSKLHSQSGVVAIALGAALFSIDVRADNTVECNSNTTAGVSSTECGTESNASGTDATALGSNANASEANSVALGANTATDRTNSVAIGGRQLTQVAAGTQPTAAANHVASVWVCGDPVDELNAFGFRPDFAGISLEDSGFSNCSHGIDRTALPYFLQAD